MLSFQEYVKLVQQKIVLYCASGSRSALAAKSLKEMA